MFVKLTRMDGSPIWLNASFIVTVEPRRGGGSVVVPIGDGLDYDVRESPDGVLKLLGDVPSPMVVPVPAPKMLAPTHENLALGPDESAEPAGEAMVPSPAESAAETPAVVPEESAEPTEPSEEVLPPVEEKSVKKGRSTVRKTAAKSRSRTKKPAVTFPEEQVQRLKKMAPGSTRKLINTLTTQFKVERPEETVQALEAQGVIALDGDHIVWR